MLSKIINYKSTHMHVILVCDLSLTPGFPVLMCSIMVDGSHKQFINAFLIGCFIIRGGTCMRYQGEACHVSFNSTLTPYSDSPRFFDNKFWLPATEEFLANGIKIINTLITNNEECRYIMVNVLCHYTVPPCYSDGVNIDYCRGDCEAIFKDCSAPLNQVIGAVTVYVARNGIDFIHTGLPNCSRHKTAQYYENKPNRTCIKTGFFSE